MRIDVWNDPHCGQGTVIMVTPDEALQIIQSLSAQMLARSSNVGRMEFQTPTGLATVAVVPNLHHTTSRPKRGWFGG